MIFYQGFEQEVVIGDGSVQDLVVIHLDEKQMTAKPRKNSIQRKKWKHEDHQPDIPPFVNQPKLNVNMPKNADMIDF